MTNSYVGESPIFYQHPNHSGEVTSAADGAQTVADNVIDFAVNLLASTRPGKSSKDSINEWIDWGAGPRASQCLIMGAKARAALDGRPTPDIEDVKSLALPVLRHRILPNFNAEAEGMKVDDIITQLLE